MRRINVSSEKIAEMVEDCANAVTVSNSPFNRWEEDFIYSIVEQWGERQMLSEAQMDKLEDVWEKI